MVLHRRVEKGVKRGREFEIEVDGDKLVAYEGETIATVLLATGRRIFRALFGKGVMLTVIIGFLGLFLRSDYSLLSATILDIAGYEVATTMLGVLSFSRFVMAAIAPLIAGTLYQTLGMKAALFL